MTALELREAPDLADALTRFAPIGLDELNDRAALQTRVDRKYVLPLADARDLLRRVSRDTRALQIDGARSFGYESVYFDTPDLTSYLLAAHRRRRRFKIRTRTYLDSAECWLEVKTRDGRGRTVKHRAAHPVGAGAVLTAPGRTFAAEVLVDAAVMGGPAAGALDLTATLVTRYHRSTLYLPGSGSRVTVDTDLSWLDDAGRCLELPELVILETKTGSTASPVDRLLWSRGHRPTPISKFATGLAALQPDLPANRWQRVLNHHFATPDRPQP
ncbi:polyphosphate polymerase domain-containing protein [Pengzhenrongella frigida]|uniref:Polyphosphate polymerase domain-containing protein n=1 Tax=Pengzhenrongella frigida TaxID=1259133 RepID=A0A4Q5N2G0_9MICO|nr:polyphosphate polymerase domain-containing protein [Cellulomonas sp. HLT2-17]RYV52329.1 polyphosphate polymerase domain-containing protein [Cellulomonas sp. HLT2-17]